MSSVIHRIFSPHIEASNSGMAAFKFEIEIYGFRGCVHAEKAEKTAQRMATKNSIMVCLVEKKNWQAKATMLRAERKIQKYTTSPFVFVNGKFIGGAAELEKMANNPKSAQT